jgi:hypothetical protein
VRVTAATTRNWQQRQFRKDFISLEGDSHSDDIASRCSGRNFGAGEPFSAQVLQSNEHDLKQLMPEALACLEKYHWPGNAQQLENAPSAWLLLYVGNQLPGIISIRGFKNL